jgi:drug/metabolite transporter (DMT)-like permease
MKDIILWTVVFSISTAISIVLLGNRALISGNLLTVKRIVELIFSWQFILAMIFALFSRFSFILLNNAVLKVPELAQNSTTVTTFATAVSFIFVAAANYIFLQERLTLTQILGASIIIFGLIVMLNGNR